MRTGVLMFASFHEEALPFYFFITIKFRPFYLPCDFSSATLTAVFTHPCADTNAAVKDIHNAISMCENGGPITLSIVAGDFRQANLVNIMPEYKQHVTCPSRNNGILDHCYYKVKRAYKSLSHSCEGDADHAHIMMMPIYGQMLERCKPSTRTVNVWMPDANERLQD